MKNPVFFKDLEIITNVQASPKVLDLVLVNPYHQRTFMREFIQLEDLLTHLEIQKASLDISLVNNRDFSHIPVTTISRYEELQFPNYPNKSAVYSTNYLKYRIMGVTNKSIQAPEIIEYLSQIPEGNQSLFYLSHYINHPLNLSQIHNAICFTLIQANPMLSDKELNLI